MAAPNTEFRDVHGTHDRPIALPLSLGPATGYDWVIDLPEGVTRVVDGPAPAPEPGRELGAAQGGAVHVRAGPGEYRISARLARPRAPQAPIRVIEIHLTVD